ESGLALLLPPLWGKGGMGGSRTMANQNARTLRKTMTDAERALWHLLREKQLNGHRFRRQVPIDHYIADFACLEARVIVEVDGGQDSDSESDQRRTSYLQAQGFRVVRFWNNDVLRNREGVLRTISEALK